MVRSGTRAIGSRPSFAALCLGLFACGDTLVGADYRGVSLFELTGRVLVDEDMPDLEGTVRVAVCWSSLGEHGTQHLQQMAFSTSFPAFYELHLYTPPPPDVFHGSLLPDIPVGIGIPLIFDDVDHDNHYDPGIDHALGTAADVLVFFLTGDIELCGPPQRGDAALADGGDQRAQPWLAR